ncbi:streptophobe family protein [Streptomyces sp. HMX87]|uniref:streptophobe family protein n=1 Tax=Streptomyces sp. HMX87 TaxID=3390849 RepID=UPI003A85C9F7
MSVPGNASRSVETARYGGKVPWADVLLSAVAAVSWALIGMAGTAALGLHLLRADVAGSLGPMTAAVVALGAGGSVTPSGDVSALGFDGAEAHTAIEITPLGVSLAGALLLSFFFLRSLRAAGVVVSLAELLARAGAVVALFVAMLGGLARVGHDVIAIDGGSLGLEELPGGGGGVEIPGLGDVGDIGGLLPDRLGDLVEAEAAVGFTVDTGPTLLGGLGWSAGVLLIALLASRRTPLPRGWDAVHRVVRPAVSAVVTVLMVAVAAGLAAAACAAIGDDRPRRIAGAALLGAPNGVWLGVPVGLSVPWEGRATGEPARLLPDPLDELLSVRPDEPVTLARLAELDGRLWLLGAAAALTMLLAGVLTAVRTPGARRSGGGFGMPGATGVPGTPEVSGVLEGSGMSEVSGVSGAYDSDAGGPGARSGSGTPGPPGGEQVPGAPGVRVSRRPVSGAPGGQGWEAGTAAIRDGAHGAAGGGVVGTVGGGAGGTAGGTAGGGVVGAAGDGAAGPGGAVGGGTTGAAGSVGPAVEVGLLGFAGRCAVRLGVVTALALPLLAWLTQVSVGASLSVLGFDAFGAGIDLHGDLGTALVLGAAWGAGAGAAGALFARAAGAAGRWAAPLARGAGASGTPAGDAGAGGMSYAGSSGPYTPGTPYRPPNPGTNPYLRVPEEVRGPQGPPGGDVYGAPTVAGPLVPPRGPGWPSGSGGAPPRGPRPPGSGDGPGTDSGRRGPVRWGEGPPPPPPPPPVPPRRPKGGR